MMSGLKTPECVFLELIYLAETGSGFMKQEIPESIFIDYLKLSRTYEELEKQIDQKFDRMTRERFQNEYSGENWPDIDYMKEAFNRKLEKFKSEEDVPSNYHQYNIEPIKNAYQFYCTKTGHIHGKPIPTRTISDRDFNHIVNMMNSIGEAILLKEKLQEVQDHLEFHDIYSTEEIEIFDRVADACWEFYNEDNSITKEEILFRVENKSQFKKYFQLPVEEAKLKAAEAAKQWFRDVKKNSGIDIPK